MFQSVFNPRVWFLVTVKYMIEPCDILGFVLTKHYHLYKANSSTAEHVHMHSRPQQET
jgi:hypothetical protein